MQEEDETLTEKNMKKNQEISFKNILNYKKSNVSAGKTSQQGRKTNYDEYLMAMKRIHHRLSTSPLMEHEIETPRARRRKQSILRQTNFGGKDNFSMTEAARTMGIIASMVPDEIIYKHSDYSIRSYETALMFCDVSGFTKLCEAYTSFGRSGPSRLTKVLNSYIGAMVQEILTHNGDVLKFSGDAFLSMWKKTARLSMQDVVHNAIDCGLNIQKNYGNFTTDVGVVLKVKVAISAGMSHFSIIGDEKLIQSSSNFVIIGQPVWDAKMAQYMSKSGDVLTAASAWMYVNEAEYWTQPCGDGRHTKVLGVGASWKRVEKLRQYTDESKMVTNNLETVRVRVYKKEREQKVCNSLRRRCNCVSGTHYIYAGAPEIGNNRFMYENLSAPRPDLKVVSDIGFQTTSAFAKAEPLLGNLFKEFSLRPAVIAAVQTSWFPGLRRFMATPVLNAVDNNESLAFLTEVRRVVVVFLNIITKTVTNDTLIELVDAVYKLVSSVTLEAEGLVNKVSMFDKDMMILIVFGLRGLSHEDEAQHALLCAFMLKGRIVDENIISVSIGVTSGTTYCGVVGHVLRREYTVIGPAVNRAARLMMTYQDKVTCDKETFLRSKLEHEYFRQLEPKPLKGISKPGPVYEFNYYGWAERPKGSRHPLLDRKEEMRQFKIALQNALEQQNKSFTRYRDHIFGIAFTGPKAVGKKRLVEECLYITPYSIHRERIILTKKDKVPYHLFRKIMLKHLRQGNSRNLRENKENNIRQIIDIENLTHLQIHGINTIFNVRFPLPENFEYEGDILLELSIKMVVRDICTKVLKNFCVEGVDGAQNMDIESWRLLLVLLETKIIFFVLSVTDVDNISVEARSCLENNMILKVPLGGIDHPYLAALACQLLDVQAIPADLEKVIESASNGMPGWIQNFLIALVQRGALTIVTLTRTEVQKQQGLVMPPQALLQKDEVRDDDLAQKTNSGILSSSTINKRDNTVDDQYGESIQVAVMAESYTFEDMKNDMAMAMDAIILKTYDSLTPFEKMLLKCGSVLGDIFSRRMLLNLLQSDSSRKVAEAVAKLFSIRVLECEGGDFTRNTSLVLIHPAPARPNPKYPYCACLGTRQPASCRDMPMYAFCGYMKFRRPLFRTITYEILTETQKLKMHTRALLYLERYTRRCSSCRAGCFKKLLGLRCDDGLIKESEELKKTRHQISAISDESKMAGEDMAIKIDMSPNPDDFELPESEEDLMNRIMGEYQKLYDAYLEYIDLCVNLDTNLPQAVQLLIEVESFIQDENFYPNNIKKKWVKDFSLASVYSLRGICMLESRDYTAARKQLLRAMQLYNHPFPTSTHMTRLCNLGASFHQVIALYIAPNLYIERDSGIIGNYYEDISITLHRLYRLFLEEKEPANAALAAKWCLHYALRTNTNFRFLCVGYGDMIRIYGLRQQFSRCQKLEKRAMEICWRKRGLLDVTELPSVGYLYTSIFLFYVDYGKKMESLEYGLPVMHMVTYWTKMNTRESLVLCMLKLLLDDLKIHDMVTIMRNFFYFTDVYDLCSETWYYYHAILILLDTGYCVESYNACETFYMKKGDALLRSALPDAAWNFVVCMWLVTIRVDAWERSILWEGKIKRLVSMKFNRHECNMMLVIRLAEGLLITLVREMDNRNMRKVIVIEKHIKLLFGDMEKACRKNPTYRSRFCLLYAYFNNIIGKKQRAFTYLDKARNLAKEYSQLVVLFWVEHTRDHWKGFLKPQHVDYWCEHVELDNLLDYRDINPDNFKLVPYTLPLPTDLDK